MIMIYLILPVAGSIFLLASMFYGAYRIAGQPAVTSGSKGIILIYILLNVSFSTLGSAWVNLIFAFLFPFAASWTMRKTRICFISYCILTVAVFLTDAAVIIGFQMLWAAGIIYLNSQDLSYILLVVVNRMAEFMVIMLTVMAVGKKAGRHITARQAALSVVLPLFSIFNMYCMAYMMQIYFNKITVLLFLVNLTLLVSLNIYFCVLVDIMGENYRLENERNLYRQQIMMQHRYYEQEEEKYEESRKLLHDIRSHILVMEELYSKEQEAGYARDIHGMLNRIQQKYYTSEKLLNIILNDKVQQMQRLGVRDDIKVGEICLEFMEDVDVTSLFANLLDNAIAAAGRQEANGILSKNREKYEAEESAGRKDAALDRYVKLRVNMVRQFLSITMENSCDREPEKDGFGYRSQKAGHEGLGLKIIRRTVEQYGGDVQFGWTEGVFATRIMLAAEAKPRQQA